MKRRTILALAAVLAAGSCDGGPEAGELTVTLETAQTGVGAVAFAVSTLEPNTVNGVAAACSGCQVAAVAVSEREMRGILIGDVSSGGVLHVSVSNIKRPTHYTVRVLDAATKEFATLKASDLILRLPAK
jgi:hypothetical protein